ncbi:S-adenosyl-L-methionine-dependent methyltransferase [Gonapodya prolifera JEL478]|uniref:S-adenosyl-L-methionine-dependent methyltransferase n=1 Tax=Gonapodya prolifera (strain JEL478) TaxID=1344416 RepID=A0A139AY03_GONPJ|nr:S-adenosyl-L-methionine-dependent methyltransferase [Gonapodya prolifera JEL478]|eukprot:KXS21584.1 S-adenosyl-L-methionine-dependent methyltransferase [Gonapodya prolifera JEL478]
MRLNRLRSALWAFEVEDPNSADSDDEEERAGKTATLQPHPEHGKVHPTLIPVPPSPAPSSEIHLRAYHISALRARLTSVGYTAPALAELFRAPRGYGLPAESLSNPATRMDTDTKILALDTPSNSNLVTLTRFFLIGTSLARSVLEPALTPELLAFCEDQNMVFARDDATKDPILHPLVQLNPVTLPSASTTLFIVTDFSHSSAASVGGAFDPVMHLGMDSLALVGSLSRLTSDLHLLADRAASENRPLRALDLCTGSGIQGLTAAALLREQQIQGGAGVETTLVDTNPRAGRLAAFNSSLNGLHVAVHIGDGYTPLPVGVKYDLILANPPYIPTGGSAVRLEAYGDGGAKGDDVMAAVFRGLQSRLVDGGMVCVVGNIVNPEQFAENVTSWVGNDVGLNGTLKYGRVWTVDEYSALIVGKEDPDYANALRQSGVQGVANGLFVGKKVAQRDVSVVRGTDELWHEMNLVEGEKA